MQNTTDKNAIVWSSHRGSVVTNPTSSHGDVGWIPGLAQWVKDPALLCELWCRWQTQLGSRAVAAVALASIGPIAWEPPYAADVALEKAKNKKIL